MKSNNIFLLIFTLLNIFVCDDNEQSISHIKKYIKPGDIYSLDITKFVDLQTNSIDFKSNVDYVKLPGFSKEIKSLTFQGLEFNPIETKYGQGSFFILQKDQRKVIKFSQKSLQVQKFILDDFLSENLELKCNDLIVQENYLWVLCKNGNQIYDKNKMKYNILQIDYLSNEMISDTEFFARDMLNFKFKLERAVVNFAVFYAFDKQHDKSRSFLVEQYVYKIQVTYNKPQKQIDSEEIKKQEEIQTYSVNAIEIELSSIIKSIFTKQVFSFKVLNFITDFKNHSVFLVVQQKEHKGKHVLKCDFQQYQKSCYKFIEQKVVHFFYKNQNYLYVDESLALQFCSLGSYSIGNCKEGLMKKSWKILSINIEKNRGLVAVEDNNSYYVFINDFSNGHFNWYKDNLQGVKNIQLFQSEILDNSHHVYFMIKFKQNSCDFQNLTFNKYVIVDSANIKKDDESIDIFLGHIQLLKLDIVLWDGKSLLNYLDKDKVQVAPSENQIYSFKMPWTALAPKFDTNEVQQVDFFSQAKINIMNKTIQEGQFLIQDSALIYHNKRIYAFQENAVNIFMIVDFNLRKELVLFCEQQLEYDLIKDNQLRTAKKYGNMVIFADYEQNKILSYQLNDNSVREYEFISQQQLQNCQFNSNFLLCSKEKNQQGENLMTIYKFNSKSKIEQDIDQTKRFNSEILQFIKNTTRNQKFEQIKISDFDIDQADDQKLTIAFSLFNDNTQKPLLVEVKIKNHTDKSTEFQFKQIFREDLVAGDITESDKIYSYNGQTIVVQTEPVYKVFMQKSTSFTELPFLETASIKTYKINKERGLLCTIYRSSFDHDKYIAVYQLTQDASIQLLANQKLEQFEQINEEDIYIDIISISNVHVLINIVKKEDNNIQQSFVLNQTGPILYTKELTNEISINSQGIVIESQVDQELFQQNFNFVNDEKLKVKEFKEATFDLKEFVTIEGNIENIQVSEIDENQQNQKIIKIQNSIEDFHSIDYSFLHLDCLQCKLNDNNILGSDKESKQKHYVANIDNLETVLFDINKCNDYQYNQANETFLCLKQDRNGINQILTFFQTDNDYSKNNFNNIQVQIDDVKVDIIHSTIYDQIYQVQNSDQTRLTIISVDLQKQLKQKIIIDAKQLQIDMLFIKDNFSFIENYDSMKLLNTIVYDQRANKLYLNSVNLENGTQIAFLNRIVDLNDYETQTYGMKCKNIDSNVECYIIGKMNIQKLIIFRENKNGFNKFNWMVQKDHIYKNALYNQVDEIGFEPVLIFNEKHLILLNKDPSLKSSKLVHYFKNNKFSDFVYETEQEKQLMDIQIQSRSNTDTLVVLLKNQLDQAEISILKLNEQTQINIGQSKKKTLVEKRQLNINFTNGSHLLIDFDIVNEADFLDDESQTFFQRHWLIICSVILLCLLAFFLLIVLLVLLRQRKKINTQMIMVNENNNNIPLEEI